MIPPAATVAAYANPKMSTPMVYSKVLNTVTNLINDIASEIFLISASV
jgi:hypothetical protein